jgi:MarR family transcriptional regulator, organic hydroperoxide resistance regulator
MREEILGRVNADLLSVPPLVSRLIRKKLVMPTLSDPEMELKMPHFEIMRILKEEGTLHPAKIGEKLCIAKAQMTHFVDKLVELNFVKREWGEDDRRTVNITLTGNGHKLLEEQDILFTNALRENMASLTDAELETLSNSLRILRSALLKLQ